MGRWPEGARQRLQDAALELFAEHGYAATTVDQVAERAGVSQRTFFRHFRDKEEVLFSGDDPLREVLVEGVRGAPEGATPRELVAAGLLALARVLQPDREVLRVRARVLASDVALQGRDLAKQARWVAVVADGLGVRGVPAPTAGLLAAAGAGVFRTVYAEWLADDAGTALATRLAHGLDALAAALAAPAPSRP